MDGWMDGPMTHMYIYNVCVYVNMPPTCVVHVPTTANEIIIIIILITANN